MQLRSALLCALAAVAALLVFRAPRDAATSHASAPAVEAISNSSRVDLARRLDRMRGAVGIARRDGARVVAAGVLVAPDVVLTCRHVTQIHSTSPQRREPSDLAVRFEADVDPRAAESGPAAVFPVLAYAFTSEAHDFCLLRVGAGADGRLPDASRVQRLSVERLALDAPIYVIHHLLDRGLHVTTGAHVLFPYEATGAELDRMAARLRAHSPRAGEEVAALRRSYRPTAAGRFLNYSTRWAGQPTIGARCMTFDGSSGAPVYDSERHLLVGILYAGGDPRQADAATAWANHEAILPAAAILEDLRRNDAAGLLEPR